MSRRPVPGWLAALLLIVFWPVGLALTWRTGWSDKSKIATTVAVVSLMQLLLLPFNVGVVVGIGEAIRNPAASSGPSPTSPSAAVAASTSPTVKPSSASSAVPPSTASARNPIVGAVATTVSLSDHGPWIAGLRGFDLDLVQSVSYYVRDAGQHWHSLGPVTAPPFEAELPWWTWDDNGDQVVTAHVQVQDGRSNRLIKDPGGWHHVDGRFVSPRGHLEALINSDDSLNLRYRPDHAGEVIERVQFWLRLNDQWHKVAEAPRPEAGGPFEVVSVPGTQDGHWKADNSAVSVHVVWPGGRQSIDPAPWVWRDHFTEAPLVPLSQNLQISGAVTGQLTTGLNPHPLTGDDPTPTFNVPTWTRCALFTVGVGNTTAFEADIVGVVGGKTYALSIVNLDLGRHPIPGTYTMDQTGYTPIDVTFASTDGSERWSRTHGAEAIVTFADRSSGSIAAVLPDRPSSLPSQRVTISGTWRCGGAGPVTAAVPQLPVTAQASAPPTPAIEPPATAQPLPPDPMEALRAQGISAICNDGTYSYSRARSGTCSHHQGVRVWTGLI